MDPFQLSLHTHTPVTSVTSVSACLAPMYDVHTPRGTIRTPLVVYATNAYTSHLLPHLTGPDGIVPVRGQVAAIRANVGYVDEGDIEGITRIAWKGMDAPASFVFPFCSIPLFRLTGNEGFEYWFPRPHPPPSSAREDKHRHHCPLIILGGARETLKEKGYGMYETDDGDLDPEVSEALRMFLPAVFPGKFGTNGTVEVEWVSKTVVICQGEVTYWEGQTGIMGFTKSGSPFVSRDPFQP